MKPSARIRVSVHKTKGFPEPCQSAIVPDLKRLYNSDVTNSPEIRKESIRAVIDIDQEKGFRMRKTLMTALAALLLLSSAASAGERTEDVVKSCVFPGWGQYSTGRYTRGTVMMGTALLSIGVIGGLTLQYNRHVDSYEDASKGYAQATYIGDAAEYYSAMTDSWNDANDAHKYRNIAFGVLAGMYVWSIVDIMIGPEASTPPVTLEIRPDGFMLAKTFTF